MMKLKWINLKKQQKYKNKPTLTFETSDSMNPGLTP